MMVNPSDLDRSTLKFPFWIVSVEDHLGANVKNETKSQITQTRKFGSKKVRTLFPD